MSKKPILGRFRFWTSAIALGVFLVPPGASAQSSTERVLRESEFLAGLDASHPAVIAHADALARAESELRRARTFENPSFDFEFEAPTDQADQSTLTLGWKPPFDGRRGAAIDAGEAGVEAARHDLAWVELEVREEMRAAFASWAVAERRRALVAEHLAALRALEERLKVRAERGEESRLAARRFTLAVTEVRAELAHGEAELVGARARAAAIHGDLRPDVVAELPAVSPPPMSLGQMSRPDLHARRSDVVSATLHRRLAGHAFEFPSLFAGWTRVEAEGESFDGPVVGISWDVPVFDRNQGDRLEATREVVIAKARLQIAERRADQRLAAARAAYASLHSRFLEVEQVVEDASELVDAATASFLAGESSMTDLLETLRSVLETKLASLDLHARVLAAHRELELSVGRALTEGGSR